MQLADEPKVVISNDQPWEGPVVEAPCMWQQGGKYFLFYSGNTYATPDYGVGYAVADRPEGESSCVFGTNVVETVTRPGKRAGWLLRRSFGWVNVCMTLVVS